MVGQKEFWSPQESSGVPDGPAGNMLGRGGGGARWLSGGQTTEDDDDDDDGDDDDGVGDDDDDHPRNTSTQPRKAFLSPVRCPYWAIFW